MEGWRRKKDCSTCKLAVNFQSDAYFDTIYNYYLLIEGGYVFERGELTFQEYLHVGMLRTALKKR